MKNQPVTEPVFRFTSLYQTRTLLILFLFFFSVKSGLLSQCTHTPEFSPSLQCEDAPLLCLDQYCNSTTTENLSCCPGWCGINTAINNPQYFKFIPIESDVRIEIHVDNCTIGTGLQSAILGACPWDVNDVVDCDPGVPPGGTMVLEATGLMVGEIYWLLIDGTNGAICGYTITSVQGIQADLFELSDLIPEETVISDTVVCPGFENLTIEVQAQNLDAYAYAWSTTWDGEMTYTDSPTLHLNIPLDAPAGFWEICVSGFTGCDTTNEICIPIEIRIPDALIKDTVTLCPQVFPFDWFDQIISGPGTYTTTFNSDTGCPVDSIWTIYAFPAGDTGQVDVSLCALTYTYENVTYDQSGTYLLTYPGQGPFGCDSSAWLNLSLTQLDVVVEAVCDNKQMLLSTYVEASSENPDSLMYAWYSCAYDSLYATTPDLYGDTTTCYSLVVNYGICVDTISSTYTPDPCESPCSFVAGQICAGVSSLITTPEPLASDEHVDWLIEIPGSGTLHIADEDSIYVLFPAPGLYEASATFHDNAVTHTCTVWIEVIGGAEISLCCDQLTCDTCATLTLSISGIETMDVSIGNGNFAFFLSGVFGNFDFEVCPMDGFPQTYNIASAITTSGCPAAITGDSVITIGLPTTLPPVIVQHDDTLCVEKKDVIHYAWHTCDSADELDTTTCFIPSASGCYCISTLDAFGCEEEACTEFFLSGIAPIEDYGLLLSPNPTLGLLQIHFESGAIFPVRWQVTDALGKVGMRGQLIQNHTEINLASLPSGVYFIKFNFGSNRTLVRKIMLL